MNVSISQTIKKETKKHPDISIDEDEYEDIIDINDPSFNFPETKPIIIKEEPLKDSNVVSNGTLVNDNDNIEEPIEYDETAFEQVKKIVSIINQQHLSELKQFLLEKMNKPLAYFHKNEFIKEGFITIYEFIFQNTEMSEQFSSFFAFRDILLFIKGKQIYRMVFEIGEEELDAKINILGTVLKDIIQKQMKEKKKIKNKKLYQKRKEKEKEKLRKKEEYKKIIENNKVNEEKQSNININSIFGEDNNEALTIEEQIAVGLIQCDEQDND